MKYFLWILGGFAALGTGLIAYAYLWGLIPVSSDWIENNPEQLSMTRGLLPLPHDSLEQLKGGGHYFIFDGRDFWLRFKVNETYVPDEGEANPSELLPNWSQVYQCNPAETEIVKGWFLNAASHPTLVSWVIPWRELDPIDQRNLAQDAPLNCRFYEHLPSSPTYPNSCGHWWLHNRETDVIYVRYACYN